MGPEMLVGSAYSLTVPDVVMWATFPASCSTNQMSVSSGPRVMPQGKLLGSLSVYSVKEPEVVVVPILPAASVYQRLESGPVMIQMGSASEEVVGNSVITPDVVIRP